MKQTLLGLAISLFVPATALANPFAKAEVPNQCVVAAKVASVAAVLPWEAALASTPSTCNFDSDCKVKGVVCRNNRCSNAPDGECRLDSECGGEGKRCSSGKCK